jgi:formylglycine-generating enzyme required for sulfatase activity
MQQAGERLVLPLGGVRRVEMAFRRIPAGRFRMGQRGEYASEEPVHGVEIPYAFWMGETLVTHEQFAVWKPEHENQFAKRPRHPAESMTWHEAVEYCEWLTKKCRDGIPVEMEARLPQEAEWEYACRAGTTTE